MTRLLLDSKSDKTVDTGRLAVLAHWQTGDTGDNARPQDPAMWQDAARPKDKMATLAHWQTDRLAQCHIATLARLATPATPATLATLQHFNTALLQRHCNTRQDGGTRRRCRNCKMAILGGRIARLEEDETRRQHRKTRWQDCKTADCMDELDD